MRLFSVWSSALAVLCLGILAFWPELDAEFSGLFASGADGFALHSHPFLNLLEKTAFYGSRALGGVLVILTAFFFFRHRPEIGTKTAYLLLCLLIGPGLLANVVFKDHWGRARPRDIEAFGGAKAFTPAFVMSDACVRNCSFVSGDGAFGFYLTGVAFIAPPRRRRAAWAASLGLGCLFGGARILMGAHFLSDVIAAALLVLGVNAVLYALFFSPSSHAAPE